MLATVPVTDGGGLATPRVGVVEPLAARPSLVRGAGLVGPALTVLNVVGYVLTVGAARAFDHDAYGQLNALLGVLLVLSVPALGVQTVVARSVAQRPRDEPAGARESSLLRWAAWVGVAAAAAAAAAAPLLASFLHTGLAGPLWVAVQIAPMTLLSATLGVVQGHERFTALAGLIGAQALGKLVGLVPLLTGGSAPDLLAALTVGTTLAAGIGLVCVRRAPRPALRVPVPSVRDLGLAVTGLFAVLLLANVDVPVARNLLSGEESGRYAVGSVLAKIAFFLPQAVAVVIFPRLSEPAAGRQLLRKALMVVGALGLVEVLGCLLLARPVLEITFGPSYGSLDTIAWLWVLQGVGLSVVQLLVYRAIATGDSVTARLVGAAAVLEVAALYVVSPAHPRGVIAIATSAVALLAATLLLRSGQEPAPA